MSVETVTVVSSLPAGVVRGRWGYYPCERETFIKLKQVGKIATLAIRQAATYSRWLRKQPDTDGVRRYYPALRDASGRRYGYETDKKVRPEPAKPDPRFFTLEPNKWTGEMQLNSTSLAEAVWENYRRARFPVASAGDVKRIKFTEAEIDALLA